MEACFIWAFTLIPSDIYNDTITVSVRCNSTTRHWQCSSIVLFCENTSSREWYVHVVYMLYFIYVLDQCWSRLHYAIVPSWWTHIILIFWVCLLCGPSCSRLFSGKPTFPECNGIFSFSISIKLNYSMDKNTQWVKTSLEREDFRR